MRGFRFRSILYSERCAHICLSPSQNSNLQQPNIHVSIHFEPIFSLRVHGWILRGCRRKRQLSFLYNVFTLMYRRPQLAIFGTAFSGELPQARTVLLFGNYSGQIFPRRNLLTRRRKQYQVCTSYLLLCVIGSEMNYPPNLKLHDRVMYGGFPPLDHSLLVWKNSADNDQRVTI